MKSGECIYIESATGEKIIVSIADRRQVLYKTLEFNKRYNDNDWIPFDVLINNENELTSGFYVDESKHTHDISATLRKDIHAINENPNYEELIVVVDNACRLATREDYFNERKRLINNIVSTREKLDNIDRKARRNGQARDLTESDLEFWKTF